MTDTVATWGGWAPAIRDDPFGHFAEARAQCPVLRAQLAVGRDALDWAHGDGLVLRGLVSLPVNLGFARP